MLAHLGMSQIPRAPEERPMPSGGHTQATEVTRRQPPGATHSPIVTLGLSFDPFVFLVALPGWRLRFLPQAFHMQSIFMLSS